MITDALHHSHPIEMPIKRPTEINEIFDDITYEKGISSLKVSFSTKGIDIQVRVSFDFFMPILAMKHFVLV